VHSKPISDDFTFFVVFARTTVGIDTSKVDVREAEESLTFDEINDRLLTKYGRPLTVVAAATGSDAHTVGLASILTMKGRSGDHGLEKYSALRVVNLGSQVSTEELVEAVQAQHADVVLISQVITQRGVDKKLFMNARLALEAAGLRDTILLVGGGPGVSMRDASLLGFDGMFGRGTTPSEVAAFLTSRLLAK
jgi:beta-lysine 5,6-aminomutase beta subunit